MRQQRVKEENTEQHPKENIQVTHTRAILSPIMFSLTERHWLGAVS